MEEVKEPVSAPIVEPVVIAPKPEEIAPPQYQLTVRIPLAAMDDIEARQKAQDLLKEMRVPYATVKKLQRLQAGKQPEGVKLE